MRRAFRARSRSPGQRTVWNAAAALAHQYAPSRYFNMLYGARLEADGFASAPARNLALEQALGVRTGAAPSRVHVSPRVGFTYTYNRDRDNGSGTNQTNVGRFYRSTTGMIRGGIGEFRDLLRPGILADASASTGLPGGTTVLSCVGAAVPAVDWSSFSTDASSIPTQCLDGSGVLAERAPSVTLIDPGYDVPRSWRASLDWNTSVHSLLVRIARPRVVRSVAARRGRRELRRRAPAHARRRRQSSRVRLGSRDRSGERRGVGCRVATVEGVRAREHARERSARLRRPAHLRLVA